MLTVAGHDSTNMKDVAPTVMFFVPSRDGVSHNEQEFTGEADMVTGLDVLEVVLDRLLSGIRAAGMGVTPFQQIVVPAQDDIWADEKP
ncbi:M20/M25/M40 family metallo-hydrolase [Nonomuraea sp. NPDC050536]|uniref:M20/M25/M40 family metallo-hydrolase n=1 Tax=Nonomuraea sp. NPDC050536 TaxID=3364366 RepID=UPI0037C9C257